MHVKLRRLRKAMVTLGQLFLHNLERKRPPRSPYAPKGPLPTNVEAAEATAWLLVEYLDADLLDNNLDGVSRLNSWLKSEIGKMRDLDGS